MLRDFETSCKIALTHQELSLIVRSHLYWPKARRSDKQAPSLMNDTLDAVSKQYAESHQFRCLEWHPDLTRVTLTVDFADGSFDFVCSEPAAVLLLHVSEGKPASLPELQESFAHTGWDLSTALDFWIRRRVLIVDGSGKMQFSPSYNPQIPGI